MAGYGIRYGVVVIQSAAALLRRYNVRTVTVHGNMEMTNRVMCPWCDRIFPAWEGRDVLLLRGQWATICESCYKVMEEQTGQIEEDNEEVNRT